MIETQEDKQRAIIAALEAKRGMAPATSEALSVFNAKQSDWFGTCRKCGQSLTGSMAELKGHSCGSKA